MAILAGGLVLGVGGAATLAVWTDTEWAYGGSANGTVPGVGTSTFEIEQDAANPYNPASPSFASFETSPGDSLTFSPGALALTPGDVIYAPIAMRTTSDSVGGTLLFNAATGEPGALDENLALWDALTLTVKFQTVASGSPTAVCDEDGFATFGTSLTLTGTGLGAGPASAQQSLAAASGNIVHYCLEIAMPDEGSDGVEDLQGLEVTPVWQFSGTSTPAP